MANELPELPDDILAFAKSLSRWLYGVFQFLATKRIVPAQPHVFSHEVIYVAQVKKISTVFAAPASTATDAVKYKTVYTAPAGIADKEYPLGTNTDALVLDPGTSVTLAYEEGDDAGNWSPVGESLTYVALDDVPPPAPGAPAVFSHEVTFVDDTPPAPPAEAPPA